jgi:hypothetical protein
MSAHDSEYHHVGMYACGTARLPLSTKFGWIPGDADRESFLMAQNVLDGRS